MQRDNNMAYTDKNGDIVLDQEDKENLRNGFGKDTVKNLTNWIIWGTNKDPYKNNV